jgi:hypothetical protein
VSKVPLKKADPQRIEEWPDEKDNEKCESGQQENKGGYDLAARSVR